MNIKNAKMNFLGDSITFGAGVADKNNTYWKRFETSDGCLVRGYGISGTRIARQHTPSDTPEYDADFGSRVADMDKDADVIVVFGGTNDYGHGDAPLGKMSDRTTDTFYGALHCLYTSLINKYPHSQLVVMTPLHRLNESSLINTRGLRTAGTLEDYVNIITEVAGYYAIPVLDLYRTSGLQPEIEILRTTYIPDGLHPNDAGHERIFNRLRNFLISL